jgi:hypothetical protein
MKGKCRSVNRNCCLGIWNLYFVFQFPNCRARRVSWILHGDIWILKSVQVPKSAARRVIWNLDGPRRFLETVQALPKSGRPPPSGLSLPVQCVRLPRCFRTDTCTFLFSCVLETRNHGKWKLRSLYRYCMYARFPQRERPSQRCMAPGARNGLARARVAAARAAGGSASRRSTLASSPHRLLRGALKVALAPLHRRRHLLSGDGGVMAVSADMLRRHFRTIGFARRLPSQQAQVRHRQWLAL